MTTEAEVAAQGRAPLAPAQPGLPRRKSARTLGRRRRSPAPLRAARHGAREAGSAGAVLPPPPPAGARLSPGPGGRGRAPAGRGRNAGPDPGPGAGPSRPALPVTAGSRLGRHERTPAQSPAAARSAAVESCSRPLQGRSGSSWPARRGLEPGPASASAIPLRTLNKGPAEGLLL